MSAQKNMHQKKHHTFISISDRKRFLFNLLATIMTKDHDDQVIFEENLMRLNPSVIISHPPFQFHGSGGGGGRGGCEDGGGGSSRTSNLPKSPVSFHVMTPISSPMQKMGLITTNNNNNNMRLCDYFELEVIDSELNNMNKSQVVTQEAWLPITESREGNAFYAAFHTLNSGIGFQALVLPLAFPILGWIWGIACLSLAFIWQLYTIWLLTQLHETDNGMRYSRYLQLSIATFGEKLGKVLCLLPTMYLSGGTCVALIMVGSETMKIFFQTLCGPTCNMSPLTTFECYIAFTVCAVIIAQLPNLNSIAGVSLIGATTSVGYCTLVWVLSVHKGRPAGISYDLIALGSGAARICSILNALGLIVFAFRGHNLVLEIQGTMPPSTKKPSRIPMWQGVKFAYLIIALCLFPLSVGGYWAYGNLIPTNHQNQHQPINEGILSALYIYHGHDTSKFLLALTSLLVVIHSLSSFQIYAMPVFDNLEFRYTSNVNKPCPRWLRFGIRVFFGCLTVFIATALPFLPSLAGLLGGIALPITLAYPCIMWIKIKKPHRYSPMWFLNCGLGFLGILLSILLVAGAIWSMVIMGMEVHFFKPQ